MTNKEEALLDKNLIIRVSKESKDRLARTAKQYGMFPTQLARHLIERQLPQIDKNRFFENSA